VEVLDANVVAFKPKGNEVDGTTDFDFKGDGSDEVNGDLTAAGA
jgi:hypothetical protein